MGALTDYPIRSKRGDPVWELATHFSPQGSWTLSEFLSFTDGRRGIEFKAGTLEFLPMPTEYHQTIVMALLLMLKSFAEPGDLGKVLFAGLRVKLDLAEETVREPDVVFMLKQNAARRSDRFWRGADLVMEVVSDSPNDIHRDYVDKRAEYEQAGIAEYWIVDPNEKRITVLALRDGKYVEHCVAREGETASSALLQGFTVEAAKVFQRE